jgi:ABC-type branched-subunit amino acid transport system ATPase component
MAKLLKEDLIKSHIAFAKRLVAEGVDIQNMNDETVDEGIMDYFQTITPAQKMKFAQNAIESNDPEKLYNAVVNCFEFTTNSELAKKALKATDIEKLKALLDRGIRNNFTGLIKAQPNLNTKKYDASYNPKAKVGSFGSTEHKAIS